MGQREGEREIRVGLPLESPLGGDSSLRPPSTFSSSPSDSEPCHPQSSQAAQRHGYVSIAVELFVAPNIWSAMSELVSGLACWGNTTVEVADHHLQTLRRNRSSASVGRLLLGVIY